MALSHLDFLNKNMYRKYPIRGTSTMLFTNGFALPQSLIVGASITTLYTKSDLYFSKVYAKDGYVSVLLSVVGTGEVLGSFNGAVTSQNQQLILTTTSKNVAGSIVIGDLNAIDTVNGSGYLSEDNGRLEASTIFCFTPPRVTSFTHNQQLVTGYVTLKGKKVSIEVGSVEITLGVPNKSVIFSKGDFSSLIGNCPTPIITKINTVSPDSDGNIDVYGIDPVTVQVATGKLTFSTPSLTLNDLCPERTKLSPPNNDSDVYYDDIFTVAQPEWKTWPQFSDGENNDN